jgi:hypothetical protein
MVKARVLMHALVLLSVLAIATTARADTEIPSDVSAAAVQAGVDERDLLGAVVTTGLPPFEYLYEVGELQRPVPPPGRVAHVRLTYYVEDGLTYSGGRPYSGSTACSWNFAIGTRFRLPNGDVFVCNDRGLLGSSGWLDLWRQPALARSYGPYVDVEVLP